MYSSVCSVYICYRFGPFWESIPAVDLKHVICESLRNLLQSTSDFFFCYPLTDEEDDRCFYQMREVRVAYSKDVQFHIDKVIFRVDPEFMSNILLVLSELQNWLSCLFLKPQTSRTETFWMLRLSLSFHDKQTRRKDLASGL